MASHAHRNKVKISVLPDAAKAFKRVYEPYAAGLGHLLIAWNRLQETLGGLFHAVLGKRHAAIARAIWHASDNDRIMREALGQAARVRFDGKKKHLLADIEWLLSEVHIVAGDRNTATHALLAIAMGSAGVTVVPDVATGHPKSKKLRGKDLIAEFAACEDRASQLSEFGWNLRMHMLEPSEPWPERPGLPHFPPKQTQAEQRRQKADKLRRHQRQASRAKSPRRRKP